MVRRYGYGVPQLQKALRSADDSLTLIAQGVIRPFESGALREMHLYNLPWPKEALLALDAAEVKLQVTLSYFIEPNPGRKGWRKRHRYQSHGLRFELKRGTDSVDDFRRRINKNALEEGATKTTSATTDKWFLGSTARDRGSIHSDTLKGTAVEIAERGVIAVYPVTGWWKEQPARDRSGLGVPYSLVVSIETDAVETDIWTPVAIAVGVPIETVSVARES